jgi:hypothetical protein
VPGEGWCKVRVGNWVEGFDQGESWCKGEVCEGGYKGKCWCQDEVWCWDKGFFRMGGGEGVSGLGLVQG